MRASVPVIDDLDGMSEAPDLIHANHHPVMMAAAARFPDTPVISAHQDFVNWLDAPQPLPAISRWIAVDRALADRLIFEGGVPADRIEVVLNAVDTRQFSLGRRIPAEPRRALAFAKNSQHIDAVNVACSRAGIEVTWVGSAVGRVERDVSALMRNSDLVFGSALTALEAMACGRAVIVCDGRGLAGFCTPDRWRAWRPHNFGLRMLNKALTPQAVSAEIERYSREDAEAACELTRTEADLERRTDQILGLYERVLREAQPVPQRDTLRVLSTYISGWSPQSANGWPEGLERAVLIEKARLAETEIRRAPHDVELALGTAADTRFIRLLSGFHADEAGCVWLGAKIATLKLRVRSEGAIKLSLRTASLIGTVPISLDVVVNGVGLATWRHEGDGVFQQRSVDVPAELIPDDGLLFVTLRPDRAASPMELGVGTDERRLSVALASVTISGVEDVA